MTKKLFSLVLCLCMLLSVTAGVTEENWDAAYDVVVIGFGGAGASAAIAAADAGANVLVLEKAPATAAGGNTKLSGQQVLSPTDVEKALAYFDTIFGGYTYDKELVRATTEGMAAVGDWMLYLNSELDLQQITYPEFPEVEGSETMRCWLIDGERSTGKVWKMLTGAVDERAEKITVWYESPAIELVQDHETGMITGVVAEHEGRTVRIGADRGVVMAMGGYENNQEMIRHYYHLPYAYPKGTVYNTGDGVTMAMKVGAALWNMNNPAGPDLNFKDPQSNVYYGYSLAMTLGSRSTIYVGPDATRFINEAAMTRHGKMYTHGTWQTAVTALPAYAVFDEAAFTAGPVTNSGGWSKDNSAELEKGWILKADTLAELAGMIGVDAAALEKTVNRYNWYCEQGEDYEFNRAAKTLLPLSAEGPYYAMPLTPTLTNTQGGAVRNANCEVIDLNGDVISHLYSAGEFGSMYIHGYNGGGNVSEALVTGRIAGTNAAKADKSELPAVSNVIAAARKGDAAQAVADTAAALELKDGTYQGTGRGMASDIVVDVVVAGGRIESVNVIAASDTPGIFEAAVEHMPARIVEAQSTNVDAVAGATMTSNGVIQAVEAALANAK